MKLIFGIILYESPIRLNVFCANNILNLIEFRLKQLLLIMSGLDNVLHFLVFHDPTLGRLAQCCGIITSSIHV